MYHPSRKLETFMMENMQSLTLSWRRPLSYRNQSIDFWFLYDNGLCHERVKDIAQRIMNSLIDSREKIKNIDNIRNLEILSRNLTKRGKYRLEIILYKSPYLDKLAQIWESQTSQNTFKARIRKRDGGICACRLCKHYERNIRRIINKSLGQLIK